MKRFLAALVCACMLGTEIVPADIHAAQVQEVTQVQTDDTEEASEAVEAATKVTAEPETETTECMEEAVTEEEAIECGTEAVKEVETATESAAATETITDKTGKKEAVEEEVPDAGEDEAAEVSAEETDTEDAVAATGSNEIHNPVYNKGTDWTDWSYVYFGMFPNREITEDDLLDDEVRNANYNIYGDAIVGGHKICRKAYEKDGKPAGKYHYYLYEPIKWKVLKVTDDNLLLVSDKIIDLVDHESDWKTSVERSYLNGYGANQNRKHIDCSTKGSDFLNTAFNAAEQDIMETRTVADGCQDLVTLLTEKEMCDTTLGFDDRCYGSTSRTATCTNYAEGVYAFLWGDLQEYEYETDPRAYHIIDSVVGSEGLFYNSSFGYDYFICPVICINRDSDLYSTTEPDNTVQGSKISKCTAKLSKTKYSYSGKARTPKLTVRSGSETLVEGVDYTYSYKNNVKAGKASVVIRGTGDYVGTLTTGFTITPIAQSISCAKNFNKSYGDKAFKLNAKHKTGNGKFSYSSSDKKVVTVSKYGTVTIKGIGKATITVTAAKNQNYTKATKKVTITVKPKKVASLKSKTPKKGTLALSWSRDSKVSGYEIQCCQNSNFKSGVKTVKIKNNKTTKTTIKKLKSGRYYFIRIRTYKKVTGTTLYGNYSSVRWALIQ